MKMDEEVRNSEADEMEGGERSRKRALLTCEMAIEIYSRRPANGNAESSSALSEVYGVSPKAIRDIWNRRTWAHATKVLWTISEIKSESMKPKEERKKGRPVGSKDSKPRKRKGSTISDENPGKTATTYQQDGAEMSCDSPSDESSCSSSTPISYTPTERHGHMSPISPRAKALCTGGWGSPSTVTTVAEEHARSHSPDGATTSIVFMDETMSAPQPYTVKVRTQDAFDMGPPAPTSYHLDAQTWGLVDSGRQGPDFGEPRGYHLEPKGCHSDFKGFHFDYKSYQGDVPFVAKDQDWMVCPDKIAMFIN